MIREGTSRGRRQYGQRPRQRHLACCLLAFIIAVMAMGPAKADDIAAGKKKAATVCAACHGLDGLSKNPDAPNLAGDPTAYIIKQLRAFKSGARQQDQMSLVAQGLTEDDIANAAAWYSNLKVTVKMPQ